MFRFYKMHDTLKLINKIKLEYSNENKFKTPVE